MMSFFIILKYKFLENFKTTFLIFVSSIICVTMSFFLLSLINSKDNLENSIDNSYINPYITKIYKYSSLNNDNDYSLISYERPSINELINLNLFKKTKIEPNLDFLFASSKLYSHGIQVFEDITYMPYNDTNTNFCISNFEAKDYLLSINYNYIFNDEEIDININLNINKQIKEFNFLSTKIIYYPINYLKDVLSSISIKEKYSILDDIYKLNPNDERGGYSLFGFFDKKTYENIIKDNTISDLYYLECNSQELKESFMSIYNSLLDFSIIFLIVIIIINFILLAFSINNSLNKNRKDFAILKSYGYKNSFCKDIYLFESLILLSLIFFISISLNNILSNLLISILNNMLNISFILSNNNISIILYITVFNILYFLILFIMLFKIKKINLKKELCSI